MTNKEKLAQIFPDGIEWSKDWLESKYYERTSEISNKCGKWIREKKHHKDDFQEFDYWDVRCSECGARKRIGWTNIRHCPMCGAKMAESEDKE